MSDWMNVKLVHQYQHQRFRESVHNRLVREIKSSYQSKPIYAPALAIIGGWLVKWGSRLQLHYGNIVNNITSIGDEDCSENFMAQSH